MVSPMSQKPSRTAYQQGIDLFKEGGPMPPKPDLGDGSPEEFWLWRGYHMAEALHALQVANETDRARRQRREAIIPAQRKRRARDSS